MTELGDAIKKLIEIMRPPQRSINNNMRDLLGLISKQNASAQEEHSENKTKCPCHANNYRGDTKEAPRRNTAEAKDRAKEKYIKCLTRKR